MEHPGLYLPCKNGLTAFSIEEPSHVLGISPAAVKRYWSTAKAWLHQEIGRTEHHDA